jgi:hypothetical protein
MCLNEAAMKAWDLKMHRSNCAWLCSGFLLYSLTETKMKNIVLRIALLAAVVCMGIVPMTHAQIYLNRTNITLNDNDIKNFTGPITTYATLSNFAGGDVSTSVPYTPTSSNVASGLRVFGGGSITGLPIANNWILATFPLNQPPVSTIVVFPSMDHFNCWDGYQYAIQGSNDGITWTPLFDALTVPATETGNDDHFTNGCKLGPVGTFSGTAPLIVNNAVIPCSAGFPPGGGPCLDAIKNPGTGPNGSVGYEAFFDFGTAYRYYAFGASTAAINAGNSDQELSAVGTGPAAITLPLRGNGFANSFVFFPSPPATSVTYNVIYPADFSVPANTTMTISPNVLVQSDCNTAIDIPAFSSGEPTCTTFFGTTPASFSVIFDVACSLNGAPSTSDQCPKTTGFNPFVAGAVHSSEDISNILTYATGDPIPAAPQMLTAHEGNNDWVSFGLGFQPDCCTRGSGGSNYNSLVVAADFPGSSNQKIQAYPFNGGPVTNLNFPPNGYLSITAVLISGASVSSLTDNLITTQTNAGLLNLGGGCYNFGWATQGVMPGQTYKVTLNAGDGQANTTMFQFK